MSKQNFDKFINKKVTGAKKKEKFKQEKKAAKKEREAYFIEKKREVRAAKKLHNEAPAEPKADKPSRNKYPKDTTKPAYEKGKPASDKKFEGKKFDGKKPTGRPYPSDKEKKTFKDKKEAKTYTKDKGKPVRKEKPEAEKVFDKPKATSSYKENKAAFEKKASQRAKGEPFIEERKPAKKSPSPIAERPARTEAPKDSATSKKFAPKERSAPQNKDGKKSFEKRGEWKPNDPGLPYARKVVAKPEAADKVAKKPAIKPKKPIINRETGEVAPEEMPLNKFIAHGGVCSRRDAGKLVKSGKVKVNGVVITEPGYKVQETDDVYANGKKVTNKHNLVYILLNKPKDYITTTDDPQERKTVLDIVSGATDERIYPVGRLDRNTSGVLLLTNDGELAQQLTHPSYEVRKIYEAKLDKPLAKADFDKLLDGVKLEDGLVKADSVAYADSKDRSVVGIEIHSGRNRVVRRMFEALGYDVKGLDRVMFATLTKKNVDRGTWRFLEEKEVRLLKFFNKSKK